MTVMTRKPFGDNLRRRFAAAAALLAGIAFFAAPAAAEYRVEIPNNLASCQAGAGPAVLVTISGIKSSSGRIRVQSYRATQAEWLAKGRWLNRIEVPARAGTMTVCMPVPAAGSYGIAVRHDVNGNGSTDLRTDGGAMSNNPSINIFNLGRPSYRSTAFNVGQDVRSIAIVMKYF